MQTTTTLKPALHIVAPASAAPGFVEQGLRFAAIAAATATVAAIVLAVVGPATDPVTAQVEAFQQHVMPAAATGTTGQPAAKQLAQRYIGPLSAEQRQQIGDQVRTEQRAGFTLPGREAFVTRRLELYEQALQGVWMGAAVPVM